MARCITRPCGLSNPRKWRDCITRPNQAHTRRERATAPGVAPLLMRTRSTIRNTLEKEEERIRMRIVERRMRTPSLSCDRITPFQPRSFFAGREGLPPEPSDCPVLNGQTPYSGLRFVFISGSPGGGTTSLYSLISSSHNVANMCGLAGPFCEGGFLAVGKNCHDMEGIAQTEACAANAVSSRTGFARIIGAYRKIWDSKSRRLYVEKTPGLNLVWAPHLVDYLVSQGVNASAITFMILTRSPCYPGKELRHRIGVEDHTFMPIWSDPQLARQWGPGQRSPARAELANRTHRNVSFAFRQRWELERTMGTLAQVNRRGAGTGQSARCARSGGRLPSNVERPPRRLSGAEPRHAMPRQD